MTIIYSETLGKHLNNNLNVEIYLSYLLNCICVDFHTLNIFTIYSCMWTIRAKQSIYSSVWNNSKDCTWMELLIYVLSCISSLHFINFIFFSFSLQFTEIHNETGDLFIYFKINLFCERTNIKCKLKPDCYVK